MRLLLWLGLIVVCLVGVFTSLTQVGPNERAVVRRFGRILPDKPGPGLYVGLPFGIDRVDRIKITDRRVAIGFNAKETREDDGTPTGQLLTGDHNLVNVQGEVVYRVREEEVDKFLLQQDRVDTVIAWVSESILAEWVAGKDVQELLLRGQHALGRRLVEELPRRLAPYGLGIEIEGANLKPVVPPEEVREEFDKVNQAETGIHTKVTKAIEEANTLLFETKAEQHKRERDAQTFATKKRLEAEAEAQRFLTQLAQYRLILATNENYLQTLWLEEMTRLYEQMGKTGRIDLLDHFLEKGGLSIIQGPPKKK